MKISYNWLKQFIDLDLPVKKAAEILTDTGLEVENIEQIESVKGGLKGVVVGEVLSCKAHPNADRLKLTLVDIGEDKPLPIVCGAPNVAAGQKVAVATIGTVLYDKQGAALKIKKGKIRGEESFGMICAEDELGLGNHHEGIMTLDAKWKQGTPVSKVFEVENDYQIEIGLTPNRADAMGHLGVARDLKAALLQQFQKDLPLKGISDEPLLIDNHHNPVSILVEDEEACPRYTGITLENIEVKPSPKWLQNRLKTIGLSPINNIVDATNYILHDLGHPLHAFDLDTIENHEIYVRKANKGEKIMLLDGKERVLHSDDLVISDKKNSLCLAGVFGGLNSGVKPSTTKIFLESAYFNPVSIRKTAKRHSLSTDSSFRFERGVDPEMTLIALKKAACLIQQISGGEISSEIIDVYPKPIEGFEIRLKYAEVTKLIGESIPQETILRILASLDICVKTTFEGGVVLHVPAYRVDVQREADVIEEILRIYGYNKIAIPQKINSSITFSKAFNPTKVQENIANHLASMGFNEMLNNSLENASYNKLSANFRPEHTVTILNPLSQDLNGMRQSLLWGGLQAIAHNIHHKNADVKLFEFGKTYHYLKSKYKEYNGLCLLATGKRLPENWIDNTRHSDFYYMKGIIENILLKLKLKDWDEQPTKNDIFSEGIQIKAEKKIIVELGVLRKTLCKHFSIDQLVVYADFNWDFLLTLYKEREIKFEDFPKFPGARRDLALLLDKNIYFKDLYEAAFHTEQNLLRKVNLFDVYEGEKLPEGKKSYALSFELRHHNKTLTDKQIDKTMRKLICAFQEQFNAVLRG